MSEVSNSQRDFVNMSSEQFDKMMCERFPGIFANRNKSMMETCMCWGFDVGHGWRELLFSLCEKLEFVCQSNGDLITVVADQVKSKFASLRFYWHTVGSKDEFSDEEKIVAEKLYGVLEDLISHAEDRSGYLCEVCGEYGKTITIGGWQYTFCQKHETSLRDQRAKDAKEWASRVRTVDLKSIKI
jgi:hypothetical protein